MADDRVVIRPAQVSAGVTDWETVHTGRSAELAASRAAILALSNAGTFGADSTAATFLENYQAGGGPEATLFGPDGGQGVLERLGALGPAVLSVVQQHEAADQQSAAAVEQA